VSIQSPAKLRLTVSSSRITGEVHMSFPDRSELTFGQYLGWVEPNEFDTARRGRDPKHRIRKILISQDELLDLLDRVGCFVEEKT
jgi:hypothetical protein